MGGGRKVDRGGGRGRDGRRPVVAVLWGDAPKNAGDPAMLECAIEGLRDAIEGVEIVVLSAEGAEPRLGSDVRHAAALDRYLFPSRRGAGGIGSRCRRLILGVRAGWLLLNAFLYRAGYGTLALGRAGKDFLQTLSDSDLLYNAGGGNLNEYWPRNELYPKCLSYLTAWALARPVVLSGQTIGPLEGTAKRLLLRTSLKCVQCVALRDGEQSASFLRSLGFRHPGVAITGDEAISLALPAKDVIDEVFRGEGLPTSGLRIGINLRDPGDMGIGGAPTELGRLLASTLDRIIQNTGARLVFIPLDTAAGEDDRVFMDQVLSAMSRADVVRTVRGEYPPGVIKGLIARMDAQVGMAYHSLLFALSAGVPAVGLYAGQYYRMKIRGLFEMFEMEGLAIRLTSEADVGAAERAVTYVLREQRGLRRAAIDRTGRLASSARWPIEVARRLIVEEGRGMEARRGAVGANTSEPATRRGCVGLR